MADPNITEADAQAQLAAWLAASIAVSKSQSYSIGNRSLTRADLKDIQEQIKFWNKYLLNLSRSGGLNIRRAVNRDI